MCEGVSLQKVTKLIVDGWLGDRPEWQKRCPDHQNQRAQSDPTHRLVASQIGKGTQQSLPQMVPAGRHGSRDDTENSEQDSAIHELMAMHVRKNELIIINNAARTSSVGAD